MKTKICILAILLFSSIALLAQTSQSEIDKIAKLYKDSSNVIIYTTYGELKGHATIEKNNDSLPQSVMIFFKDENIDAAADFLSNLIKQKISQGYQVSDGNSFFINSEYFKNIFLIGPETSLGYKNGNMYFVVRSGEMYMEEEVSFAGQIEKIGSNVNWFSIETGDNNRKGGQQAKEFKF